MKKITAILFSLLIAQNVFADTCAKGLTGVFTSFQAAKLCSSTFGTPTSPTVAGNLTFTAASAKIIPGATSLLFRNTGDSATNLSIVDAGTAVFRDTVTSTGLLFPTANEEAVAGAGTTVADAAALSATKHIHQLTGANGAVGWKFPSATVGSLEILLNTTAGVPKVYAVSGGTCNGGGADVACTLVTGIVAHICYATAANTWICS